MISQSVEYALRAVVCLAANQDRELSAKQIAHFIHTPVGYLSKVLQILAKAKIVSSQRGRQGGFLLAIHPSQLTVLRVINAVHPLKRIDICFLDIERQGLDLCPLQVCINDAISSIEEAFEKITIAGLAPFPAI
jgi:Rrf2 family nitric oxide-sensitive transcriptional repressor